MRTARTTMIFAVVLALPYLVVGVLADGQPAAKLLGGGAVVLVIAGIASAFMIWRGKKIDQTQDEREDYLVGNATRFSFYVMAVAVQLNWALVFAHVSDAADAAFWLLAVMWVSFLGAYVYYSVRH